VFQNASLVAEAKRFLATRAERIAKWGEEAAVRDAVLAQNARGQSAEEIQAIDAEWRAGGSAGLAKSLTTNECAEALRRFMSAEPAGNYREAFATDAKGAIVCTTERTSDYWQADETKWIAAYNNGLGALFIGPVRLDESVGKPLVQLSAPIFDGSQVVGVLIVGKVVQNLRVGQALERQPNAN
jgi:hypothetical protein